MADSVIKRCFVCGLAFFSAILIFLALKIEVFLIMTLNVLPGFVFGFVLTTASRNGLDGKGLLFVIVSGVIYFLCEWISMEGLFNGNGHKNLSMVMATTFGAVLLFVACKFMLSNSLSFGKGLIYSIITGIVSSILPIISMTLDSESSWFGGLGLFSVFITWQTLFGWAIKKAERQPLTMALGNMGF